MSSEPITPTRIIPAGWPVPRPAPPAAPPPPPPAAPTVPPPAAPGGGGWSPPPPPWGAPIELRVVFVPMAPVPVPEPTFRERLTGWLTDRLRPLWTWRGVIAIGLAVFPIPWTGYSAATTWASTVYQARQFGYGWGYALGGGAVLLAGYALRRGGPTAPRMFAGTVAAIGFLGAISLYDPVLIMTGVHR